jgi:hypothetical protein
MRRIWSPVEIRSRTPNDRAAGFELRTASGTGESVMASDRFVQAVTEAANRAEVTALLIRYGYRVYRPEADIEGEDLVVRAPEGVQMPEGQLRGVQLKGRPIVHWKRYGDRDLWMLFPSAPYLSGLAREWFLVPHDDFFAWVKERHGSAPKWDCHWSYPSIGIDLASFLSKWQLCPALDMSRADRFVEAGDGLLYRDGELIARLGDVTPGDVTPGDDEGRSED